VSTNPSLARRQSPALLQRLLSELTPAQSNMFGGAAMAGIAVGVGIALAGAGIAAGAGVALAGAGARPLGAGAAGQSSGVAAGAGGPARGGRCASGCADCTSTIVP